MLSRSTTVTDTFAPPDPNDSEPTGTGSDRQVVGAAGCIAGQLGSVPHRQFAVMNAHICADPNASARHDHPLAHSQTHSHDHSWQATGSPLSICTTAHASTRDIRTHDAKATVSTMRGDGSFRSALLGVSVP